MNMRQFASEMHSVVLARKQENHLSSPLVPSKDLRDACDRHFIRKSLFKSTMKEIARNLEKTLMDFLHTDLLSKNWNYKAGPNKWSKKEIIGHLIDSAQINLQRFVRSTYMENFTLTYDQVEWVDAQHYISADFEELIELWRLLNRQIIRVLENYPTHRLQVQSDTGKASVCFHTVEHLAQDYLNHLNHHLKAIEFV
jgi:DinB superfamily